MLKNKNGITLTTMIVTIVVMLLILGTLSYSAVDSINVKRMNNFYSDLRQLSDAVEIYYLKNGKFPVDTSRASIEVNKDDTRSDLAVEGIDFVLKSDVNTVVDYTSFVNPNDYSEEDNKAIYKFIKVNLLQNITLYNESDAYIVNTKSHTVYNYTGYIVDDEQYNALPLSYKYVN